MGAQRRLWKDRLVDEIYRATGQTVDLLEDGEDFGQWVGEEAYGQDTDHWKLVGDQKVGITADEYYEFVQKVEDEEKASKTRQKSQWERQIEAAIDRIDNYEEEVKAKQGTLADDPPDPKEATGPGTQKDPIKVGLRQFMAIIGNKESSGGYRPSWADAPQTNDFGPTDEVRDGGYTDPETGESWQHFNKGLDFGVPVGTPIDAVVGGEVIAVGRQGDGWGVSVKIRDAQGNIHNYGHLSHVNQPVGTIVKAGDIIGNSGDTSDPIPGTDMVTSTGAHLSYDVWKEANGKYLDPTDLISGGGYDVENPDSGAAGRYQIMPQYWDAWAAEAGIPGADPNDPAAQEHIAAYKMQQYYDQTGNWADVAAMWYSGRTIAQLKEEGVYDVPNFTNGQEYPSIESYVNDVMGRLGNAAKGTAGYQLPDGTWITGGEGGSSGSGGSGSYDPLKAKQDAEDRAYKLKKQAEDDAYELWTRQLGLEESRAGEVDRRYGDVSQRMKDYLNATGSSNDLLADIAAALGNEARLVEMNQGIQDDAIATAANVNAAVQKGALGYRDAMAGPIWSNSLGPIQKELEAVRAALQTAPPGFADSILRTIPKNLPMPYEVTDILDLPGYEGEYWGSPSTKRYALGTIPRYANGTVDWRDEPYIAVYNAGGRVDAAILRRLRAAGAIDGGTEPTPALGVPDQVIPAGANSTWKPGYIPRNATLPPDLRVFDDGEWLDAAVSKAIMMISSGNSSFASAWGLGDLTPYHGMPASNFDGGVVQALRAGILANASAPAVISTFGAPPGVPTVWVPDPNVAPAAANPGGGANTRGVSQASAGGGGGGAQYSGVYGGGMDPYDAARLALEKEQLALQRSIANAQMKLDRERFDLEKIQDTRSAEYQAAQIRWNDAKAELDEKSYLLQVTSQQLQEKVFEDSVRRYEIESGMAREQLDLTKIRQEADLAYQARQLELQVEAGLLSREEYEERKRQFELTFNYQKDKDQKELDIQRAKTTVEYLANPQDAVRSQFWYASQADPVGTAYDLFTGEDRGQKTYTEAYNEDAEMFMEAMKPYKKMATGSGDSFVRDVAAILGDSSKSNKATGYEEVLYNPTGAPIMVLSNDMSRALGFVPKAGKKFGTHVREGRAS